jgi:hypothetical protein
MKLIDILKEIKTLPAKSSGMLPKEYVPLINYLTDGFGEGTSGFELYSFLEEEYFSEDYEEDKKALIETLARQFNNKTLVSNDTDFTTDSYIKKAPGAPSNSFNVAIKPDIDVHSGEASIVVCAPYIDEDAEYYVGWFDINGDYHPDTAHFDEDGNYIG